MHFYGFLKIQESSFNNCVVVTVLVRVLSSEKKPMKGNMKKDVEQNDPFMRTEKSYRLNGGKQPIYRGQMSTDDPPLDRSGYGDLGLGLVRQASHEALDINGDGDMRGRAAPRQEPTNNR